MVFIESQYISHQRGHHDGREITAATGPGSGAKPPREGGHLQAGTVQREKTPPQQFWDHAPLQQNQTSGKLNMPSVGSMVHLDHKKGEQKRVGRSANPKAQTGSRKADCRASSLGTDRNFPRTRPGAPRRGLHGRGLPEAEHDGATDRDRGAPQGMNGASGGDTMEEWGVKRPLGHGRGHHWAGGSASTQCGAGSSQQSRAQTQPVSLSPFTCRTNS